MHVFLTKYSECRPGASGAVIYQYINSLTKSAISLLCYLQFHNVKSLIKEAKQQEGMITVFLISTLLVSSAICETDKDWIWKGSEAVVYEEFNVNSK